jgi:hypothetical protein
MSQDVCANFGSLPLSGDGLQPRPRGTKAITGRTLTRITEGCATRALEDSFHDVELTLAAVSETHRADEVLVDGREPLVESGPIRRGDHRDRRRVRC